MSNGVFTLFAGQIISQPGTAGQTAIKSLSGATAVTVEARFAGGTGGTLVKVDVETTLDGGVTWIPIMRFAFANTSATKVMNISGLTPRLAAYAPVALSDDVAVDGILGDQLRVSLTVTGTYTNTTLDVRAAVR